MTEKPSKATAALLEEQLSAFIDGELSTTEHERISKLLSLDPDARIALARLQLGSDIGNAAFGALLHRLRPSLGLHPGGRSKKAPGGRP